MSATAATAASVDIKIEPQLERNTSGIRSGKLHRAVPRLQRDIKIFGMLTCLILCIVVGMSAYVVNSRETHLETSGLALVTPSGKAVSTEAAETVMRTLGAAMRQGPAMLEKMTAVAFQAELAEGNAEIIMHVGRIVRLETGVTTLYGTTGDALTGNVSATGPHEELASAVYTAPTICASGCRVLLQPSDATSPSHGRQLHSVWYKPWTWFSSHGLHYADECPTGTTEVEVRWEYTGCVCRFRWWDCGSDKAKHVRRCEESDGSRFNLVYDECQTIPPGTSP